MTTLATTNLKNPSSASNNIVLDAAGGATFQQIKGGALTLGTAQASTSGTSIDFTGIPSWVKRVTVMFNGVSLSGAAFVRTQLGTAGGVETSGYQGATAYAAAGGSSGTFNSSGFDSVADGGAAFVRYGTLIFTNVTGNNWLVLGTMTLSTAGGASAYAQIFSGSKALSGTLDRIRVTTSNGTDTFDAGSINIMYEG